MKKRKKNILTTMLPKTYKSLAIRGGRLIKYKISWFRQHIWKPEYRRYIKYREHYLEAKEMVVGGQDERLEKERKRLAQLAAEELAAEADKQRPFVNVYISLKFRVDMSRKSVL